MSSTTPDHGTQEPAPDPAGTPGSRSVEPLPAEDSPGHAQGSGKQFERGTESAPDSATGTGTGTGTGTATDAPGPGASASGKRFARGTDSDGDGHAYDETPPA